jgi:hypothetical protein
VMLFEDFGVVELRIIISTLCFLPLPAPSEECVCFLAASRDVERRLIAEWRTSMCTSLVGELNTSRSMLSRIVVGYL